MDNALFGVLQRDRKYSLKGTLTPNKNNIDGVLTSNNYNVNGVLETLRVYPVVKTQEKTAYSSLVRQEVVPDGNLKLSKVTIEPLPVRRELNEKGGYTVTIGA